MKSDPITNVSNEELIEKLERHPELRQRLVSLLRVVENADGNAILADDAEELVIQEMRQMGQKSLQAWAQSRVEATERDVRRSGRAHREGKKNSAGTAPTATSA
jgi:hypothetical protein